MALLQHWQAWLVTVVVQVSILVVGHFAARDKYLNYWHAGLIGVATWLLPLLVTALVLGLDPRAILLLLAAAIAMFSGVALENVARRGGMLSILFHTLVVLGIGLAPAALILWLAAFPASGQGWVELLAVSAVSATACGVATVFLHYNDMASGLDIYRRNGLTPGEHRTISDAIYILERKLQPRLGDAMAHMKRVAEQMQAGVAGINSANNLLGLVILMLSAIKEGADETYIDSLAQCVESDNGLRQKSATG